MKKFILSVLFVRNLVAYSISRQNIALLMHAFTKISISSYLNSNEGLISIICFKTLS